MHGVGEYRWRYLGPDNLATTYEGRFYNNSMHGYGVMSYPDGRVFTVSIFLIDTMHSDGDYLGPEDLATSYEGRFYNNSIHGYGVMFYPDGRVFNLSIILFDTMHRDGDCFGLTISPPPSPSARASSTTKACVAMA